MLADWYRKEIIKEAEDRGFRRGFQRGYAEGYAEGFAEGYAQGCQFVLEAEKQRREGETLEQALARLLVEMTNHP